LPLSLFENALQKNPISRRGFLKLGAAVAVAMSPAAPVMAVGDPRTAAERHLAFFNTHTGEHLKVCYFARGKFRPAALKEIDYILRDHRCNEIKPINRKLIDLLYLLSQRIGKTGAFHVISGYRSPKTNEKLRRIGRKVAAGSLHLKGLAIDIRLPTVETDRLCRFAKALKQGGVGYYPKSDFVHVDVGRVRYW
jgi:uncharacterized protein YcbK (DUF882 family)